MTVRLGLVLVMIGVMAGCQKTAQTLRVEVDAWGEPTVEQAAMQRFAVVHEPSDPGRADWLRRKVELSLNNYLSRHQFEPYRPQPPLVDTHDNLEKLYRAGVMARQSMVAQGYRWDPDDPDLLVSVDYCFGRRTFHVPHQVARKQAAPGQPVQEYDAVVHAHAVAVYVYDRARLDEPIWHGSAVHLGPESGFMRIGKHLFDQVMAEFPYPTNQGPVRMVGVPVQR